MRISDWSSDVCSSDLLSAAREDKRIYCAEDETVADTTSGGGKYAPSVNHLLVPTLGDLMKARDPKTQVVSVSGKDRSAIMMGGRQADELMWLVPTGLTSYRGTTLSPTAQQASAASAAANAQARPAMTLPAAGTPAAAGRAQCGARE